VSNSSDDKLLDEYLSGSTPYSSRYRRIESDDVPLELDRAVLEQASLSVAKKRSQFWWRVGPTLAIAATAIVAVSVVMRTSVDSLAPSKVARDEDLSELKVSQSTRADSESKEADRSVASTQDLASRPAQKKQNEEQVQAREKEKAARVDNVEASARDKSAATLEEKPAAIATDIAKDRPKDNRDAESRQALKKTELASAATVNSAQKFEPRAASADKPAPESSPQSPPQSPITSGALANSLANASPPALVANAPVVVPQGKVVPENSPIALQRRATTSAAGTTNADSARESASRKTTELSEVIVVTAQRRSESAQDVAMAISVIDGIDRRNPANWLKYIRQLRKDGMDDKADEEWGMLIAAYPDFLIAKGDSARPKNEANKK
jgi:hypothetical protein